MSDNTVFKAALFHNNRVGGKQPVLTGHVSIPVDMIETLAEMLGNLRTHNQTVGGMTIKTVRLPLSFWTGEGKAPLAYSGESSFYTPQAVSEAPRGETAPVDKTPAINSSDY